VAHPEMKNIYSYKGLKGETLTSAKLPGSTDHCIIAVATEQDRVEWMSCIQTAIEKASPEHPELALLSPDGRPSSLSIDKDTISRSSSSSDLKKIEEPESPKSESVLTEEDEDDKDDAPQFGSSPKADSILVGTETKAEDKDSSSSKTFSDPSSDEEDEEVKVKSHYPASLDDVKPPPSPEVRQPPSDKKDSDTQPVTIEKKVEQANDTIKKEIEEISTETKNSVERESIEDTKTHVHYYKEGVAQLRTAKAWKDFFLIVKNGLLLYFESDKVTHPF
jgi:hypothetical protein